MRAVVQRVLRARVIVRGETVGASGPGLCVLLGVAADDVVADAERLAEKIARLRIFENDAGKFDLHPSLVPREFYSQKAGAPAPNQKGR